MSHQHLILIALGPVQDFIAAARRTRDLWFGSHVLSELSRAAARALHQHSAQLIMPAIDSDADFFTQDSPLDDSGHPALNVANKILALLPAGVDPQQAARDARSEVQATWQKFANAVHDRCAPLIDPRQAHAWDEQVETLIELFAVWTPCDPASDYADKRDLLERELGARKNLRRFSQWDYAGDNAPKSSLDGARASVLQDKAAKHKEGQRLRLGRGEQLDAVGLVKRAGGKPEQFVPLVNVAYADWIAQAHQAHPDALKALINACKDADVSRVSRDDLTWTRPFSFDGHILNEARHDAMRRERDGEDEALERAFKAAKHLLRKVRRAPHPYVACLVADGDRMGQAIDGLKTPDAHKTFSKELARFAEEARTIVEQDHRGVLVYAGGDDVLAFVALPDAIACASALASLFKRIMRDALPSSVADHALPTLSVGLGIGHMLESMAHLLQLGRRAEKLAKGDTLPPAQQRDAIAIILDKRSGNDIAWRAQWGSGDPVKLFDDALCALREQTVSSKKVYQVRAMTDQLPHPSKLGDSKPQDWAKLLAMETSRLLARQHDAGVAQGNLDLNSLGLTLNTSGGYEAIRQEITQWTTRFLIARTLAEARGWQDDTTAATEATP